MLVVVVVVVVLFHLGSSHEMDLQLIHQPREQSKDRSLLDDHKSVAPVFDSTVFLFLAYYFHPDQASLPKMDVQHD